MNGLPPAEPIKLEGFGEQNLYQRREKIFTRHIGGRFQKLRLYSGWPFLLAYFALPWLTWDDRQAILFDLPARQFHLFGLTLWPQDLWLLGWLLMIGAFGLFTVTSLVGRLWCGYTCPQTVWTAIFMWVEQITEGERHQRIRLDALPFGWNRKFWNKLKRRSSKHLLWLGWAAFTALTFVGYFTPIREMSQQLLSANLAAIDGWTYFWIAFFTAATYINAGWMREQVCIYMCPYARFQSAMIDKDTLIVSYDPKRGEPRGSRQRKADQNNLGDCINCRLCVQVCPTGIDIRDGLQYQCIGCAHCIDACNQVMDKMDYPRDLISYTTENRLAGRTTRWLRPKSVGYGVICLLLVGAFGWALSQRSTFAFDILRERGTLWHQTADGAVRNDYQLKLMNKAQQHQEFVVSVLNPNANLISARQVELDGGTLRNIDMQIKWHNPPAPNTALDIQVCTTDKARCRVETTRFLSPGATP